MADELVHQIEQKEQDIIDLRHRLHERLATIVMSRQKEAMEWTPVVKRKRPKKQLMPQEEIVGAEYVSKKEDRRRRDVEKKRREQERDRLEVRRLEGEIARLEKSYRKKARKQTMPRVACDVHVRVIHDDHNLVSNAVLRCAPEMTLGEVREIMPSQIRELAARPENCRRFSFVRPVSGQLQRLTAAHETGPHALRVSDYIDGDTDAPCITAVIGRCFSKGEILTQEENMECEFKSMQKPLEMQHLSPRQFLHSRYSGKVSRLEKYICGFLNSQGGCIYFGVADDGSVEAVPLTLSPAQSWRTEKDLIRKLVTSVAKDIDPPIPSTSVSTEFIPVIDCDAPIEIPNINCENSHTCKPDIKQPCFVIAITVTPPRSPQLYFPSDESLITWQRGGGQTDKLGEKEVRARLTTPGVGVSWRTLGECLTHKELILQTSQSFIGRDWLIQDMTRHIREVQEYSTAVFVANHIANQEPNSNRPKKPLPASPPPNIANSRGVLVYGAEGSGKSALMSHLVMMGHHKNYPLSIIAHHFCRFDDSESLSPVRFVKSIASMIARGYPQPAAQGVEYHQEAPLISRNYRYLLGRYDGQLVNLLNSPFNDPDEVLEKAVIQPLHEMMWLSPSRNGQDRSKAAMQFARKQPCVILIDALDEGIEGPDLHEENARSSRGICQLLDRSLHKFPPWISFIVTMRREMCPDATDSGHIINSLLPSFIHAPLDRDPDETAGLAVRTDIPTQWPQDIREYVNKCVKLGLPSNPAAQEELVTRSQGNFLFVCNIIEEIQAGVDWTSVAAMGSGLSHLYQTHFSQRFANPENLFVVRQALEVLLAAPSRGVAMSEIEAAVRTAVPALAPGRVETLLKRVPQRILQVVQTDTNRWKIAHESFRRWLSNPETPTQYHCSRLEGHMLLAASKLLTLAKNPVHDTLCDWLPPQFCKSSLLQSNPSPHEVLELVEHIYGSCMGTLQEQVSLIALLRDGVDAVDETGRTALMLSVEEGLIGVANMLVQAGADVELMDNDGMTALLFAARYGRVEMLELLMQTAYIDRYSKEGKTALYFAALYGHESCCALILGKSPKTIDAADDCLMTPLMAACQYGHDGVAKLLLEHGASVSVVDRDGNTALIHAVRANNSARLCHTECVRLILDTSEGETTVNVGAGAEGRTPLHFSVWRGDLACTNELLQAGADPNLGDADSVTPLMVAACGGTAEYEASKMRPHHVTPVTTLGSNLAQWDSKVLVQLLENKVVPCDPNVTDLLGRTALWFAAGALVLEIASVAALLSCGADPSPAPAICPHPPPKQGGTVKKANSERGGTPDTLPADTHSVDAFPRTPMARAQQRGYVQVQSLLRNHGARTSSDFSPDTLHLLHPARQSKRLTTQPPTARKLFISSSSALDLAFTSAFSDLLPSPSSPHLSERSLASHSPRLPHRSQTVGDITPTLISRSRAQSTAGRLATSPTPPPLALPVSSTHPSGNATPRANSHPHLGGVELLRLVEELEQPGDRTTLPVFVCLVVGFIAFIYFTTVNMVNGG